MRIRYLLATVVTGVAATNGFAQTTGGTGNTGGGAPTGLQTGNASNFQIQQLTQAPQINSAETTGSTVNSTNSFSQYYANPLYQGRAGATNTELPGGFGSAMAATGGAGGGRAVGTAQGGRTTGAGATGGRTATTTGGTGATGGLGGVGGATGGGRAGGVGGTTALGGATQFGGQANRAGGTGGLGTQRGGLGGGLAGQQQQGSAIIQLPRQISYTMTMRMPMPKSTPAQIATQMQTDLRSVIDRSSSLANPKGIEVVTDGSVVVLRGRVKDEEEAATAEGVIRLTPGVKVVKNELKY